MNAALFISNNRYVLKKTKNSEDNDNNKFSLIEDSGNGGQQVSKGSTRKIKK